MRGALVAIEVALALILMVGATLMGRTLISLNGVDRGLRSDHLLTMRLTRSTANPDASRAYWSELIERVRAVPGVVAAGSILHLPTSGRNWSADIEIDGQPLATGDILPRAGWQSVSTGYFDASGMTLIRGRPFSESDGPQSPLVVTLNTVLAEHLFPGANPLGKRIRAGNATAKEWATVVGVVSSVRHDSLSAPPAAELYVPFAQRVVGANSVVVRTTGDPALLAAAITDRVRAIDRNVPISDVRSMDELYSGSIQRQKMVLVLFGFFASVGLLLSAVGVFGIVAYGVRQRTREIGVRIALGAQPQSIRTLVMEEGLRYALAGCAIGLVAAIMLARLMRGMVYGVAPLDLLSFAVVPPFLVGVALVSSWIPARRAARIDPLIAIRSD